MKAWKPMVAALALAATTACTTRSLDEPVPEIRDTDPLIAQLAATARKAYEAGEYPGAVVLYKRALERARAMDNSREIGRNAFNLAACMQALDDLDAAAALLQESERETLRAGDDAGPAILLLAQINRLRGDRKQAVADIDRLEQLPVDDLTRGQAYTLRAHIACDRDDVTGAKANLVRAQGYLRKQSDDGLAGDIAQVSGRIAELKQDWKGAAAAFDREATWMQRADRLPEMAVALELAGRNFARAGDLVTASDRFYRAARSFMAQGNNLDALRVIEQAGQIIKDGGIVVSHQQGIGQPPQLRKMLVHVDDGAVAIDQQNAVSRGFQRGPQTRGGIRQRIFRTLVADGFEFGPHHQPARIAGNTKYALADFKGVAIGAEISALGALHLGEAALSHFLPEKNIGKRAFNLGNRPPDQGFLRVTQCAQGGGAGGANFERARIDQQQDIPRVVEQQLLGIQALAPDLAEPPSKK